MATGLSSEVPAFKSYLVIQLRRKPWGSPAHTVHRYCLSLPPSCRWMPKLLLHVERLLLLRFGLVAAFLSYIRLWLPDGCSSREISMLILSTGLVGTQSSHQCTLSLLGYPPLQLQNCPSSTPLVQNIRCGEQRTARDSTSCRCRAFR